jgi:hypothetical protein
VAVVVLSDALVTTAAHAQASPYLPLDDPRLPLLEHLIARGDIADPSPMVRPFRQADARRVLSAGDTTQPLIQALRASLEPPAGEQTWRLSARAGGQAFRHIRRDVLHPLGTDGSRPYAEVAGDAVLGPFALVSRLAAEPRLTDDPEWPGRRDLELLYRMPEAYLSAQFKYGSVFYGQMERNWGPVGVSGIGLSSYAYPQVELGFLVGVPRLQLEAYARSLKDEADSLGRTVHRYFFAHRASAELNDRLRVGLWETTVLSGIDREFDGRYRNPLSLLLFTNQYGLGSNGNVLFGLDASWRIRGRVTLQAQLGIDDLQYENTAGATRYPDRWAFTLAGFGPLGRALAWRAVYTQASSLAFRTLDPFENFTDGGVGIGRNFDDMDQLTLTVGVPYRNRWMLTPEATLLRQGEGEINAPFPVTAEEAGATPQLFIGVVERTWRAAVDLRGRQGPLDLHLNAGLHHVVNAGHEEGRTVNRFEGRLEATLGISARGVVR